MARKKSQKSGKAAPPAANLTFSRLALGVAFIASAFLLWQSLRTGGFPGCGPDSGCDQVLNSRWSKLFGAPVSLAAFILYGLLLGETFRDKLRWPLIAAFSWMVLGAVTWFIILQAAVVKAFCMYCMASHLAGLTGAVLLLLRSPVPFRLPAAVGIGAVAILALTQALTPPPAPAQAQITSQVAATAALAEPRIFSVLGGQFQLDLGQVPVTGDPTGASKLVKLFDYTCHHCRDLHHLLKDHSRSNQLTIISLPVPLDPACNPLMTRAHPDHMDACEYARTGLAVYLAKPEKFEQFTDWLFAPGRIFPLNEARAYAASLVGSNEFSAALRNPRVDAQIRTNVAIYRASSQAARTGRMPQMIFQNSVSAGAVADLWQLQQILTANLSTTNR